MRREEMLQNCMPADPVNVVYETGLIYFKHSPTPMCWFQTLLRPAVILSDLNSVLSFVFYSQDSL